MQGHLTQHKRQAALQHPAYTARIHDCSGVTVDGRPVGQAADSHTRIPGITVHERDQRLAIIRNQMCHFLVMVKPNVCQRRRVALLKSSFPQHQLLTAVQTRAKQVGKPRGNTDDSLRSVDLQVAQPLEKRIDSSQSNAIVSTIQQKHSHARVAALQNGCLQDRVIRVTPLFGTFSKKGSFRVHKIRICSRETRGHRSTAADEARPTSP
mmetsp:Transcript_8034/g.17330  ORF Transcript_8034/g.17330 Transcript_8034/m.17330 type:complete len:209 (-) Transcript_8034:21-647(-)